MFDYRKLKALNALLNKRAQFVPMNPSMGGDPSMGGMPPGEDPSMGGMPPSGDPSMSGMPPGGDPSMGVMPPGGDPSMGGMPPGGDPSMSGMPPGGDPSMGGMPPGGDPSMGGQTEMSPTGEPYMKITPTQLSKLFKQFAEVFKSVLGVQDTSCVQQDLQRQPPQNSDLSQKVTELDAKIDALLRG